MSKLKKFIFISLIIIVIGGGIYLLMSKSVNNQPPQPLSVFEPTVIWNDSRTLSVLFKIENPNKNYGSDNFVYFINLYDDHDKVIKSIQKSLFIYSGETEVLAETKIDTGGNIIARAEVVIGETNWVPEKEFKKPAVKIESLETSKSNILYSVSAKLSNPNDFDISKVIFTAVLYTKSGQELAVARLDSDSMKVQRSKSLISYVNISSSMERYLDISATKYYIYVKK